MASRTEGAAIGLASKYSPTSNVTIITGDCLSHLKTIPSGTVQLLLTSPPYNVGKEYEKPMPLDEYVDLLRRVLSECIRIVGDGGSLCWQIGSTFDRDGRLVLIDKLLDNLMDEISGGSDVRLQNRIVWHFEHGLHSSRRFSGRYECVLWYTKGRDYTFNLDAVRVPQKYPGKKAYKGPKAGNYSGNPLGKNPSDFWVPTSDVWEIPNVKSNHVEKLSHPCQFPIDLAARLILALTNPGDVVLDPFGGVGTAAAAAVYLQRKAISIDLNPAYSKMARARVKAAWKGTLPFRPSAPPLAPSTSSPLTMLPDSFAEARAVYRRQPVAEQF